METTEIKEEQIGGDPSGPTGPLGPDLEQKETSEGIEVEGDSIWEQAVRGIILSYQDGYNRHNDKNEINFTLTLTTHKVALQEGNRDIAYLRLDRGIREKVKEGEETGKWEGSIVGQVMYKFANMKERLNPNQPWKSQLFMDMLTRLVGGGLEYAELLKKLKRIEDSQKLANIPTEEERLAKIGLTPATELPKPLTPDEVQYKEWLDKERAKEGIK